MIFVFAGFFTTVGPFFHAYVMEYPAQSLVSVEYSFAIVYQSLLIVENRFSQLNLLNLHRTVIFFVDNNVFIVVYYPSLSF